MRKAAAQALGEIGDSRAVEPLVAALSDSSLGPSVRRAAAQALDTIGLPLDPRTQAWHAIALWEWERVIALGSLAVEPLVATLDHSSHGWMREGAAKALGEIGDRRGVKPLIAALKASEQRGGLSLRKEAAQALLKLYHHPDCKGAARGLILGQRQVIVAPHHDWSVNERCFGQHHDEHDDVGIGVEFPL